jgi:hypothetical protein
MKSVIAEKGEKADADSETVGHVNSREQWFSLKFVGDSVLCNVARTWRRKRRANNTQERRRQFALLSALSIHPEGISFAKP